MIKGNEGKEIKEHKHDCGHHHEHEEHECSCGHHHEHEEHECGCGHHHEHEEHECGCGHHHEHEEHECGCGHHHEHEEHECGCGHHHEHEEHECGCGHHHEHEEHECRCDHHHEHEEHECGCEHHHEHEGYHTALVNNNVEGNITTVWKISGLDCANCARKVEEAIAALPFVASVSLRFDLGKLTVTYENKDQAESIIQCAKDKEPEIVLELADQPKYSKEYKITNVDCANCAAKVEAMLIKELDADVIYRFDLEKITIRSSHVIHDEEVISLILNREPEAKVSPVNEVKEENEEAKDYTKYILLISFITFVCTMLFIKNEVIALICYGIVYVVLGKNVLLKAIRNIKKGDIFDENFLMAIATIGAICIGEYSEAVAVMLFYQIGEYFQSIAVNNSRKSIKSLMEIRPDEANVERNGKIVTMACEDIHIGDIVVVNPGERVPLDGIVVEGESSIDFSALTGESLPKNVIVNDEVMSGGVNKSKIFKLKVTTLFAESTASKILKLVEEAGNNKAETEKFITKFAKIYTPAVCALAALLVIVPTLLVGGFETWLYRGLTFLVISCPCALVISIPLSYFGGIGAASKKGILIKGSQYLDEILLVDVVACDKTGTLTKGNFEVSDIVSTKYSNDELLAISAKLEYASSHPIGKAIVNAYGKDIDYHEVSNLEEIAGNGISATINSHQYLIGNMRLLNKFGITIAEVDAVGSIVYVVEDNEYIGHIIVSDILKESAIKTVKNVKSKYHKAFAIFSGDNERVVNYEAKRLGINEAYGELLPQDKLNLVEKMHKDNKKVAFVGDGMNDAPVLTLSNVGIAMGGIGSDAAIEASDIVLMDDDIGKVETLFDIAKFTKHIVNQNLVFILVIKVVVLLLGAIGYANMWTAVFADVGVSLIAIMNSMRILRKKY
ncbi:MAG: cadmium-translocating P-type ATPase [Erysipelotrichales bacterium]|nr:cadmium-translocating P-type ATPase [Erysipelotrichales bacterium]